MLHRGMELCLALVLVSYCCCAVAALELFQFGPSVGDSQLPQGSSPDSSASVSLQTPILHNGVAFSSVFVNLNGFISLGSDQPFVTDQDLAEINSSVIIVAPFWADIDTTLTGFTYHRISNDGDELEALGRLVRRNFDATSRQFLPTDLLIVTWDSVGHYNGGTSQNTFQAAIATDGELSYVLFLYDDIQWTQFDPRPGNSPNNTFAQAGLTNGSTFYALPGSGSENITLLASESNIGESGAWLFRIDEFSPAAPCRDGDVRISIGSGYDYVYGLLDYEDFYYYSDPMGDRRLARGAVEVCLMEEWGTVCYDGWENVDASVVCNQLQFSPYGAIAVQGSQFSDPDRPVFISAVSCSGQETNLLECSPEFSCTGNEVAGIVCQEVSTMAGNCEDGMVRLTGGENATRGRVEVCRNNAWGTICNSRFGTNEALVICSQLGFSSTDARPIRSASGDFGLVSGPIFLENLACDGTESEISECPQSVPGLHECVHSQDAGVQCVDIDQCLTNNGGCEQVCINLAPGFECACFQGYVLDSNGTTCSDDTTCNNGDVRLADGDTGMEGRVEVCFNSSYNNTICDDFWDELEARVVCRQLGFSLAEGSVPTRNAFFGAGTGNILLSGLNCDGTEPTLLNCTSNTEGPASCTHAEDAGVRCQAVCDEGGIRLIVSDEAEMFYMGLTDYDPSYYDKDGLRVGRVEVCVGGRYGSICYESWDDSDASVACRQLGFSPYGAIAVNSDSFGEGSVDRLLTGVQCLGIESQLLACNHSTFDGFSCVTSGAICQSAATSAGMCADGETRLQMAFENVTGDSQSLEGRLEVCVNNAWGTVCDSLFDSEDAQVACLSLSGFSSEGAEVLERGTVAGGTGPIFLSELDCLGTESSLLECSRRDPQPTGLHDCQHLQDVAIRCIDIDECLMNASICDQNCTNTIGGFNCSCRDGFFLNETTNLCNDIDECSEEPGPCDSNAVCTNTISSFECMCNEGFTGNGTLCQSINECDSSALNNCHANATCMDTLTSFFCICDSGFTGNGTDCTEIVCETGNLTLVNTGGSEPSNSGRVEVCVDNTFASVCRDRWDEIDATVVCRQLNLPTSNVVILDGSSFGGNSAAVVLDDVICLGNEDRLLDCSHTVNQYSCDTAGVSCEDSCTDGDVDLAGYVRLGDSIRGEVRICSGGVFGGICDDSWGNQEASVVCSQLGYPRYGAIGGIGGSETAGTVLTDVVCSGTESRLRECSVRDSTDCLSQEIATVICQDLDLVFSDCDDGDVRLVDGSNALEGRLEVCFNNAWGTVCENRFDSDSAGVICNQLGVPYEMAVVLTGAASYGPGTGPVLVESLTCAGTEQSILECAEINTRLQSCTHDMDVSLRCTDVDECLVNNGNCSDVCVNEIPFHRCNCSLGGQLTPDSDSICVFNANCTESVGCECLPGFSDSSTDGVLNCTDIDECEDGSVTCMENFQCINTDGSYDCICENGFNLSTDNLTCVCTNDELRLVNGSTLMEGRVEICLNNSYGTVCDDRWDVLDARVACRQLGFPANNVVPLGNGFFGEGLGEILLDDLVCVGNESRLFDCNSAQTHNCDHSEDAGVRCESSCIEGDVRLLPTESYEYYLGESMLGDNYYSKDGLLRGRVEVCVDGRFGTVCDDFWDNADASVVCRQLGHSQYGAIALTVGTFTETVADIVLSDVQCEGSEPNLLACGHEDFMHINCGPLEDAGVACQSISTEAGDCVDDQVRLVEGAEDEQNLTRDGRLEICVNNAWGTICSNNFRQIDVQVACGQLPGFQREGASVISQRAVLEEGPIFLDELFCSASDTSLLECSRAIEAVGLTTCSHTEDVWVQCTDIDECMDGNGGCEHNCTNSVGSFNCSCFLGFELDENGLNCTNIDECQNGTHNCDGNATCFDTEGDFTCACLEGFTGSGLVGDCADVDECADPSFCHPNASCINLVGNFGCVCNAGFSGDGLTNCTNINECELSLDNCDRNAFCEDTEGAFTCTCYPGYSGNGTVCDCMDWDIRLMNGSVLSDAEGMGRVEICYNNTYSTVCDDLWDQGAARVVCEGTVGAPVKGFDSSFGSGAGPIILDNVVCNGNEASLLDCSHNPLFVHNCEHTEDAAVICGSACLKGAIRLTNQDVVLEEQRPVYDFIKDELARGRVEVCAEDSFVTLCDMSWSQSAASVACRQLGFSPYGAINVSRNFYEGPGPVDPSTVRTASSCIGSEARLYDCTIPAPDPCQPIQMNAGVVCQDPATTVFSNCSDGDVRLVNGNTVLEGRVEVCINSAWGTVCDNQFSQDQAEVICRQAGFGFSSAVALRDAYFGEGTGPIFLERFSCEGAEDRLLDCASLPIGVHECSHSDDAGVVCIDVDECEESPCHENADCRNTLGSFECTCVENFVGDGFDCTRQCENGFRLASDGSRCVCDNGDVRIVGDSLMEGAVEICSSNFFGSICDDFWDELDARVVCGQLQFINGSQPLIGLNITSQRVLLDNVQCTGDEPSLLNCSSSGIGEHTCGSAAGVRCQASCLDGEVRVCMGSDSSCVVSADQDFLIDDRLSVGRVEVCSGGRYGTVCDDEWTDQAASVACRQLGFSPYGAVGLTDTSFAEDGAFFAITSLACKGSEENLFDCSFSNDDSCGVFEDAGVVCQDATTTQSSDCETGDVRLANGQPDPASNTLAGRLEVCINNAWGTVCNSRFDVEDAGTACEAIRGFSRDGAEVVVLSSSQQTATGPIFLEQLDCTSEDSDLLMCNSLSVPGIHSCTHSQDAGVRCKDIDECAVGMGYCEQECVNSIGSFECQCQPGFVLDSNGFNCTSVFEFELTAENAEAVFESMAAFTSELMEEEQDEEVLGDIASLFDQAQGLILSGRFNVTLNFTESSVLTISALAQWTPEVLAETGDSSRIVESFEVILSDVTMQLDSDTLQLIENSLSILARRVVDRTQALQLAIPGDDAASASMINIPVTAFPDSNFTFVLTVYNSTGLFPVAQSNDTEGGLNVSVATEILGFFIPERPEVVDLEDPVRIYLRDLRESNDSEEFLDTAICVSWNFSAIQLDNGTVRGNWTPDGCSFIERDNGRFVCKCNHLTNFAVLVNTNAPQNPIVEFVLQVVTRIGASLSMIGLVLTIFTLLFFKDLRSKDASKFHVQLCSAIFLMLLVFMVGIDKTEHSIGCTVVSVLIQYFTLASVFWMGGEAVLMFKKLVIVFSPVTTKFHIIISLICWGVPVILPAIGLTTLATGNNYLIEDSDTSQYCFLSSTELRIRYGIFLAPLFAVLLFNTIIFILVIRVLILHKKRNIQRTQEKVNLKTAITITLRTMLSIVSVMVVFGLSWLFGAFSISSAAMVFQWLFVVFATSQGLVIFFFHCIVAQDARKEWKKLLTCYRHEKKSRSKVYSSNKLTKGSPSTGISSLTRSAKLESSLEMKHSFSGAASTTTTFVNHHNGSVSDDESTKPTGADSDSQSSSQMEKPRLDSISEKTENEIP